MYWVDVDLIATEMLGGNADLPRTAWPYPKGPFLGGFAKPDIDALGIDGSFVRKAAIGI
ncbi:MAG: hypothetical protein V7661_16360 [Sulfitobacter sp.]